MDKLFNIPPGKFAGTEYQQYAPQDAAARRCQELRERLMRGESIKNSIIKNSINVEDNLIVPIVDFLPEESSAETIWVLRDLNFQFLHCAKDKRLDKIPFIHKETIISIPKGISISPVFEYFFRKVIQCWHVIKEFQNLAADLNASVSHHIDPNLFLQSFRNSGIGVNIMGTLSKSIMRGTGLKSRFDQDFYVNVDDLRFPYCELEVFIVYTLKHLGCTFLNLSKAYKDYRYIYCREMLQDVIETSDYCANIINDSSEKTHVSPVDYMPYGLYCYKNNNDNSIHIIHYLWRAACDTIILGEHDDRGYYMREVTVRSKYKFDDEVSYSDLEFEYTDKLITKFEIK